MEPFQIAVICLAAGAISALTLYSGFGLGTMLLPVFALFFPVEIAVAQTAAVHLANNLFKTVLVGKEAVKAVVLRFSIAAIPAAAIGALLLGRAASSAPLASIELLGADRDITWSGLTVGLLMVVFAIAELSPRIAAVSFDRRYLPVGGALAGFFGGVSGHQGAFRSAFLLRLGLTKAEFIATGVIIAVIVDLTRLPIYVSQLSASSTGVDVAAVVLASLSAFLGAYLSRRYLEKVTLGTVHVIVGVLMCIIGIAVALGLV